MGELADESENQESNLLGSSDGKRFNTFGPNDPAVHYCIETSSRIAEIGLMQCIDAADNVYLQGPATTGKTTVLQELCESINKGSHYHAVYVQVMGTADPRQTSRMLINEIAQTVGELMAKPKVAETLRKHVVDSETPTLVRDYLNLLCRELPRPLVLVLDEWDHLETGVLHYIWRQLHSGHICRRKEGKRPFNWPQSVILCGSQDLSDREDVERPFSVMRTLNLPNFTLDQIRHLYAQHSKATGQQFEEGCVQVVWEATSGHPLLVNALAKEVIRMVKDGSTKIGVDVFTRVIETIANKETYAVHFNSIARTLAEARVRKVMVSVLTGVVGTTSRDKRYAATLGLIVNSPPNYYDARFANKIWKRFIAEQIVLQEGNGLPSVDFALFLEEEGTLQVERLLETFRRDYSKHSRQWLNNFELNNFEMEGAGPHIMLLSLLWGVEEYGGRVTCEAEQNENSMHFLVMKSLLGGQDQSVVIELKIKYRNRSLQQTIETGVQQAAEYLKDHCPGVKEAHLLIVYSDYNEVRPGKDIRVADLDITGHENADERIREVSVCKCGEAAIKVWTM